jgi:hypothetical protein
MSFGESVARAVVTISARTLPRSSRERYREQWLADLRDAAEVGLNRGQIAVAALAFAVTTSHPWPERRALEEVEIRLRSRLAQGLSLTTALLGLSQYASIVSVRDQMGRPIADAGSAVSMATGVLVISAFLAPVLALIVVSTTRGIVWRERLAVWLLVGASCAPVVQLAVDNQPLSFFSLPYLSPGSAAYPIAAGLVLVAVGLLYRARARTAIATRGARIAAAAGGAAIIAAVTVEVTLTAPAWSRRVPLVWLDTLTNGPARLSNPNYAQWLTLKDRAEAMISATFVWWGIAGVVLGVLVVLVVILGHFTVRRALALTAGALAATVIADAGVLNFLDVMEPVHLVVAPSIMQYLLVAGRYALVIAIVLGIAGTRLRSSLSPDASSTARRASRPAALP